MKRETIISALKRNDKIAITAIIAVAMGADEEAVGTLTGTTRATDKFYQSVFDLVPFGDAPVEESVEEPEADVAEIKEKADAQMEETANVLIELEEGIKKAIKKGKKKKALKLIKELKATGARGSVLKGLEKQAKAL